MSEATQVNSAAGGDTPILQKFPALFKNRNFMLLWAGYVISALGDRIHFVIMLMLLTAMKGAGAQAAQDTAQLNVMMLLPFLLLGPFTGAIADRLPRRAIMVSADFTRVGIVIVARTLFLQVPDSLRGQVAGLPQGVSWVVLMLLASELLLGVFSSFFSPARNAMLPNLVHPDQLLRANSMTNAAGTIASLLGFVVGGFLIEHSKTVALYVDAGTFLCSGILLSCMTRLPKQHVAAPAAGKHSIWREIVDALKYLRRHRRSVEIIVLMFLFWCCGAIILSGLAGVVIGNRSPADHSTFHKTEAQFFYFLGLIGVGMIGGAAVCSLVKRGIPKEFGIAGSMIMVGTFFFLFSIPGERHFALATSLLTAAAFFGSIMLVSLDTLLQRIVPDYIRGRVMAVRDQFANVGLVGVAIPLAISSALDNYIILILRMVAGVMFVIGVGLLIFYYRRQYLPARFSLALRFVRGFLVIFKRFDWGNAARIPLKGPVICVANHSTAYDPFVMQAASRHRQIQFMMAKEFYEIRPFYYFFKWLKVIPVNRSGNDTTSIRTAIRALKEGACIGMFPEGRISDDGRMNEGKSGVALLALMSGATVVPAYIQGTHAHRGMAKDFLSFDRVTIYFGRPLRFDDIEGHKEEARDEATKRIMDAIKALRARYETNQDRFLPSESKPLVIPAAEGAAAK